MKQLIRLTILFCSCAALALTVVAGPEPLPSGKEMKQVAPAPLPECNWTGFYIGVNVGGQWGHSEDKDLDGPNGFWNHPDKPWGYHESGVLAGGQIGYNFQWNWLVLGIEGEGGYMNVSGDGLEPDRFAQRNDTFGETDSDFYAMIRGRLGVAFGHWLFYATGGGIGLNYEQRVVDDCTIFPCGPGAINAHEQDFQFGWVAGGGLEYMFDCHWTIRAEYLRFDIDRNDFSGVATAGGATGDRFFFNGDTTGNIVRAGLNYKF